MAAIVSLTEYKNIRRMWRGPFAGIPFELTLGMERGNGPDGKKRTYPVFHYTIQPRGERQLTSANFYALVLSGNKAAEGLSLPPPRELTAEDDQRDAVFADVDAAGTPVAAQSEQDRSENEAFETARRTVEIPDPEADQIADAEFRDIEPTPEQLKALEQNKDPEAMKRRWFATVKGSHLDDNEARAEFLARHVDGVASLSQVVGMLTPANFDEIIMKAEAEIKEQRSEDAAQTKLETPTGWHPSVDGRLAKLFVSVVRHTGLSRTEVYPFVSMVVGRHVFDRAQVDNDDIIKVLKATGVLTEGGDWTYDEPKAVDLLLAFDEWQTSDEALQGVL